MDSRYHSLIQGAAYGIYRTDLDGTILDANPALARMLGYESVDELMTHNMNSVFKSRQDRLDLIDRYNRTRNSDLSADVTWVRKDRSEIIVHLSVRIVTNEDGSVGFEGIAQDVTEKHALEEELRQAHKMEAIGRLARGVAHDFNNILAAILGTADLLLLRLKPGDPSRDDADEIRKAAERGADLTKQLLAFSRSQTLEAQRLDVNKVVHDLETMLQRLAGESVRLRIHPSDDPATVRVEPGQLEQVLLNLVVNARDAMPDGGAVDLEVKVADLDAAAARRYSGLPAGRYVRLSVRDTGVGIDPAAQAHIFEPFFTTKGPSKGTGLGLSIVYGIARDAGGTVTFTTRPNKGTTFEVILPSVG